MFFYFRVSSKNDKTLYRFYRFLMKIETLPIVLKHFSKPNEKKFVTVLKSPHVNKTAQEQFEVRLYTKEFLLNSVKPLTAFMFIKKITNLSFPGVKIKVESLLSIEKKSKNSLTIINPDGIILNRNRLVLRRKFEAQMKYIQLFDCYGELYLKDVLHQKSKVVTH